MRPLTYLYTLWNTLTNPKYYIDVLNAKLSFSVRFTLLSYLFWAGLTMVSFALIELPQLRPTLNRYLEQVVTEFPAELSIRWNGLQLETPPTPTRLSFALPALPDPTGLPGQLLLIDPTITEVNQVPSLSRDQAAAVVVGRQELYVSQPSGGWTSLSLVDVLGTDSFTITRQSLVDQQSRYQQLLNQVLHWLPAAVGLVFLLFSLPLRLLNLLLDSLLIWLMVRLFRLPLNFAKVMQLSLHAAVAAELIAVLTARFAAGLPMFTIAFWGYILLVYWQLRHVRALTPNGPNGAAGPKTG